MIRPSNLIFEKMPIKQAVMKIAIPTVVSQLVLILYNMADTFFIGQIGDPNQVAAANLCMPIFFVLTGIANLFGIGGSSLVARCLGARDRERATRASSFSLWASIIVAFVFGIVIFLISPIIFPIIGTKEATYSYCLEYTIWTVVIGGAFSVANAVMAHLVRAEGLSKQSSYGMILGAVVNIVLDPIFILIFKMEIRGASIATMLSNVFATLYFVYLYKKRHGETVLTVNPREMGLDIKGIKEVFFGGIPSFLMCIMSTASNVTLYSLMSSYSTEAIAGVGIAKKIDMLAFAIATGMSQGVVPLIAYNYSAKNYKRMKEAIGATFKISLLMSSIITVVLFLAASNIVAAFINDPKTVEYGQHFQKIIIISGPSISVTFIIITIYQSIGEKLKPMLLSVMRKGGFDVPLMHLMNYILGVNGIVWATPLADMIAMFIALITFIPVWKKLKTLVN